MAASDRSSALATLPAAFIGSRSTTHTVRGTLNLANRCTQEVDQGLHVDRRSRSGDDERARHLTHAGIGQSDDRRLRHVDVLEEDPLHLGRVHVEAADDHHVLQPVHNAQIAVLPDPPDIAGRQPFAVHGGDRRFGIVEVPGHDTDTAHGDLAPGPRRHGEAGLVDDLDVDAVDRTTGGLGHHLDRIAGTGHGAHTGGLGQPVGGHDQLKAENIEHVAHEGGWDDGGPRDPDAQCPERRPLPPGPARSTCETRSVALAPP